MNKDESWGVARWDWGHKVDYLQLDGLFDKMQLFCEDTGMPAIIGEFGVVSEKKTRRKYAGWRPLWRRASSAGWCPSSGTLAST